MLSRINKVTLVPRVADGNNFFFGSYNNTNTSLTNQIKDNKLLSLNSRQKYQKILDNHYGSINETSYTDSKGNEISFIYTGDIIQIPYFTITGYKNSNSVMWTTSFLPETVDALGVKGILVLWDIYWHIPENKNIFDSPIEKLWRNITL